MPYGERTHHGKNIDPGRKNKLSQKIANLLGENFLVEEQIIFGNKIIYKVSDRGDRALNYFGINNRFSPKSKA